MVVFDINIMSTISLITGILVFGGLVWKFGDGFFEWLGIKFFNSTDLKKADDDSPIKRELSNLHDEISEINKINKKILSYQENSYWDRMDMKADIIIVKINDGITHDIGHEHIMQMYEIYQNIPREDGRKRNSYVGIRVKKYIEGDSFSVMDYFKYNNQIGELKNE